MDVKELLPLIGGFAVGAASPQTGAALSQTLEMADALKQRKRRQSIEDETLERSRESHEWQRSREVRAQSDQEREDQERELARSMGPQIIESYKKRGWDIGPEFMNVILNPDSLEQQLQAAVAATSQEYRELELADKTPVDEAGIAQIRKNLKPGEGQWVYTRVPGGGLDRRFITTPQAHSGESASAKVMKAILGKFMEVRQAVQDATLAGQDAGLTETPLGPGYSYGMVDVQRTEPSEDVSSGFSFRPARVPSESKQTGVKKSVLNIQQKAEELAVFGMLYPDEYGQVLEIFGKNLIPDEMLDQFQITLPGMEAPPEEAEAEAGETPSKGKSLAAKYGGR